MKGSVRKRKNNAWSYRIDLGYVGGKRKQIEKGGFKTERAATKAMQDVLYHLNNTGDYVENKKSHCICYCSHYIVSARRIEAAIHRIVFSEEIKNLLIDDY